MAIRFETIGQFSINGNDGFVVLNDRDCDDFSHLLNKRAYVRGAFRKVIGVERFAHGKPWRKGEKITLVCERQ